MRQNKQKETQDTKHAGEGIIINSSSREKGRQTKGRMTNEVMEIIKNNSS
jgi:hypothetical protein